MGIGPQITDEESLLNYSVSNEEVTRCQPPVLRRPPNPEEGVKDDNKQGLQ
jgi:hypothetical protein